MIILITATPGSGKTLFACELIDNYLKELRQVFADIDGLCFDGVEIPPDDWRETPNKSVVVYDECQRKYPPDGHGRSSRDDIADMEIHRHTGHDLVLITQHPQLLHSNIRRLVGKHYHLERLQGREQARIYTMDRAMKIDSRGELKQADTWVWSYPKKYYDKYKSATDHTHKAYMPKWMRNGALFLLFLIFMVATGVYYSWDFWTGGIAQTVTDTKIQAAEYSTPPKNYESATPEQAVNPDRVAAKEASRSSLPELPLEQIHSNRVVGCAAYRDTCSCYDNAGYKLKMTFEQCKSEIFKPRVQMVRADGIEAREATARTSRTQTDNSS